MASYSLEPRTRKYVKGYGLLNIATKVGLDASVAKTCCETWWEFKKCWRINYSTKKERRNFKWIKTSIIKKEDFKVSKLLNDSAALRLVTRKWIEKNDLSGGQYSINKNIRYKIPMLRSDLCNYSVAYIVVNEIQLLKTTIQIIGKTES